MKYICHDCKRNLKRGEEFVPYRVQDKTYIKCRNCYLVDPVLRNFQLCEVFSRVVGYIRPISQWNNGKAEEYRDRKEYNIKVHL